MNILILALLLIVQGGETAQIYHNNHDIESFKWLTGTWKNVKQGNYESWQYMKEEDILEGKGFQITTELDTVITERLQIICEGSTCYYIADVPQNPEPVRFRIVSWNNRHFRSENSGHDFPKFVAYRLREDGKLEARIGDDSRTISFLFEKVD